MPRDCPVKPKLASFAAEIVRQTLTGVLRGGQQVIEAGMNYYSQGASAAFARPALKSSASYFS